MSNSFRCGYVAIIGPPNAGKSTFLNSMLGQKISIVTSKPQTTRNRIIGIDTNKDAQIVFMDTPGLHSSREYLRGPMGKLMIQAAWQSLSQAEAIILVIDGDLYIKKPDYLDNDLDQIIKALSEETRPVIVLANKVDLFHDKTKLLPLLIKISELIPNAELFPISALKKDGLTQLKELIISKLPECEAKYPEDQVSTAPLRFLAAEIIREKLFEHLHQELPYLIAVEIENWEEENERGQTAIHAAIYVGRASHKAMVIGKNGANLKEVGTKARKELVELLERKVHLELWVKVREAWTEDVNFLHEIGLGVQY